MGRYTGSKSRINRRLGLMVYENAGAVRAMERRDFPPGMHVSRRRPSNYAIALMEKQKVKHYYGLGERQLRRYFGNAQQMKGNTGQQLLMICERRLDNFVRRAGFTKTRPQARQGITHGHFQVNGNTVDKPSYMVRPGDVITIRPKTNLHTMYRSLCEEASGEVAEWVSFDPETLRATMNGLPGPTDISLPVDANIVVEFLSR
jgi:small subunit ribosomal protein S4